MTRPIDNTTPAGVLLTAAQILECVSHISRLQTQLGFVSCSSAAYAPLMSDLQQWRTRFENVTGIKLNRSPA